MNNNFFLKKLSYLFVVMIYETELFFFFLFWPFVTILLVLLPAIEVFVSHLIRVLYI